MKKRTLTPRQAEILALIESCIARHGYPPTRSEIAQQFGFRSANAAEDHLKALARKGYIELRSGVSRGIVLRHSPDTAHVEENAADFAFSGSGDRLPLIGQVAAGSPILAQQNIEDYYTITSQLFHPKADYLLRVKGESMRDAGILNGDFLAIHRENTAQTGQIIVARIEDEVTVKRFWRQGHQVRLMPENEAFQPIEIDLRNRTIHIEGRVVGLIRRNR